MLGGRYKVVRRAALKESLDANWSDDWYPAPHLPEVCDHEETFTGLVDPNGDPIMRCPRAIGFGARDGW